MDIDNPYKILDVPTTASQKEIKSSWRKKIAQVHPDVAGESHTNDAAEINAAYGLLSDPRRRAQYDAKQTRSTRTRPHPPASPNQPTPPQRSRTIYTCTSCNATFTSPHAAMSHMATHAKQKAQERSCDVCGRSPATPVSFKGVSGKVVTYSKWYTKSVLCRACGIGEFRRVQARLLVVGWWSFMAALLTLVYLPTNWIRSLLYRTSVDVAQPEDDEFDEVLKGRPVLLRPGPLTLAVTALLIVVGTILLFMSGMLLLVI